MDADWVIDLGPEGGSRGGKLIFTGTPEEMIAHGQSHTAEALRRFGTRSNYIDA